MAVREPVKPWLISNGQSPYNVPMKQTFIFLATVSLTFGSVYAQQHRRSSRSPKVALAAAKTPITPPSAKDVIIPKPMHVPSASVDSVKAPEPVSRVVPSYVLPIDK